MVVFHAAPVKSRFTHARRFLFSPAFAALLFVLLSATHTDVRGQSTEGDVIDVRTDLVAVPVVVIDRRRRFVTNLTAADFKVYDDDRPVPIELLAAGVERLALVFAFDASGSVRDQVARQEPAARALLDRFSAESPVAVLHFDETPKLAASFTTNANQIRRAFTIAPLPDRRTAIFDAALAAVRSFDALPTAQPERRIVILFSDGLDTASTIAPRQVVAEAERRGVAFYVLHLPLYTPRDGRLVPRAPAKGFRDLARSTGGEYYRIGDAGSSLVTSAAYDFTFVFDQIAAELRSQYILGFYPRADAVSGEHRIKVELAGKRNRALRLRALRHSYTRPPTSGRSGARE